MRVGSDSDWAALACGSEHSFALRRDGSLWAWGANYGGQLGLGYYDDTGHPSPVRVDTDGDWAAVARVWNRTLGAKSDGSLWSCDYGADSLWTLTWVLDGVWLPDAN